MGVADLTEPHFAQVFGQSDFLCANQRVSMAIVKTFSLNLPAGDVSIIFTGSARTHGELLLIRDKDSLPKAVDIFKFIVIEQF